MPLTIDGTDIPESYAMKFTGKKADGTWANEATVYSVRCNGTEVWHRRLTVNVTQEANLYVNPTTYPMGYATVTLSRTFPFSTQWYIRLTASALDYQNTQTVDSEKVSGSTRSVSVATEGVIIGGALTPANAITLKVYVYYLDPETGTYKTMTYPGDPGISATLTGEGINATSQVVEKNYTLTYRA